jgi:HEAT repeat protein
MKRRLGLALLLVGSTAAADKFNWAGKIDLDAEGLQSAEPKTRLDAVNALNQDEDVAQTQKYLIAALDDEDEQVQQAAARALGNGGAASAVGPMKEWLGSSDPKKRAVAADVLGDIGTTDATQVLVRSLGDTDAVVRQRAVKALGKIGLRGNPNIVIAIIPRLEDEKADVRREAIEQLEQLGDRRAVIPLVAKFGDTSVDVKKAAVRAVGKLGDRSAVPALVRLLADPDEGVRMGAAGALGSLGAVDAIDALTEQLNSGSETFKTKVAYALGQIAATPGAGKAGEDAMHKLVANLAVPAQRQGSREALRVAGKAAVPALVAALTGRIEGDPTIAVTLLGEAADARATAALAAELERGRVAIPLVLRALGATDDPAALVPVLGALSNKDATIRLAAMEALRPLLGRDARAGDVLIEHLADEELEVRILSAEYLGILRFAAAAPKLLALIGSGNPPRLRLAAIDALGEIGRFEPNQPRVPVDSKALLDVLREGPPELHRAAATALEYIADPAIIPQLVSQLEADRGPTRYELVRALAGALRTSPDPAARKALRQLSQDANVKVGVAAIYALAAAGDAGDASFLRTMVEQGSEDRRRAAAAALGDLHDAEGFGTLSKVLSTKDDRLVGDAAWALGELAVAMPKDRHLPGLVQLWLYIARHGTWAAAIDSTGALARTLAAEAPQARPALLGDQREALLALAFHKSRLVRVNLAAALGQLGGDDSVKVLVQLLAGDASPHVRVAAAQALWRLGTSPKITAALKAAADGDVDPAVKDAARTAPPAIPARSDFVTFYVVDASSDDAPVRQEAYFVHGPDGIVWATYTDARGHITSEHVPPVTDVASWPVRPASRESEY